MKLLEREWMEYRAVEAERKRKSDERKNKHKSGGDKHYTHNIQG